MNLTKAIIDYLGDDSSVTAVIAAARIFDVAASQNIDVVDGPYVLVQEVAGVAQTSHDAVSNLNNSRLQVTIVSNSGPDAKDAEEVIRQSLDNLSGSVGPDGEEVTVTRCTFESAIDAPRPPEFGADVAGHDRILEFDVWHRLSVP